MPAYADLAAMIARFTEAELVQLTDDAQTGAIDADKVDLAVVQAGGIMEPYFAALYRLPLTTRPQILEDIACDIARRRLWKSTPPEDVMTRYREALQQLKDIGKGVIKLDAGVEEQVARPGSILVENEARVFSRDTLRGY